MVISKFNGDSLQSREMVHLLSLILDKELIYQIIKCLMCKKAFIILKQSGINVNLQFANLFILSHKLKLAPEVNKIKKMNFRESMV